MEKKIIFIAGGGTGGHIYPGVAIARAMQKLNPQVDIHFVGTESGLETKIIPKENFPLHLLASGRLNMKGNLWKKLVTLFKIPLGCFQAVMILSRFKPDYVLGVGGYASAPFVLMSGLLGFPTAIWEPNAHPGLANRWLSRFVDRSFVVFDEAKKYLKNKEILKKGMPIRQAPIATVKNSSEQKLKVLVFGGSQGSMYINKTVNEMLVQNPELLDMFEFVHQTGAADFKSIQEKYAPIKEKLQVLEYIFDMPKYYQWADIAICRGGASSLAEVAAYQVVPVIVPLPAADDHQRHNAESFVRHDAGMMILQKDLTSEKLKTTLLAIAANRVQLSEKRIRLLEQFQPQGAEEIAKEILL